uniref:Uncharacterized protein n=1 Tax=Fagus sylvatica TaxID=28930 RepID=A0A2N9G0L3_FAGSY
MRKEAEKEMVVKVYPDEQGLWGMMVELQKVVKLNPNEELGSSGSGSPFSGASQSKNPKSSNAEKKKSKIIYPTSSISRP